MPYGKFKMGEKAPRNPGDRKGIMPVTPGLPIKPPSKRPSNPRTNQPGMGVKPSPLTPRVPGKVRPDMGYGPGRKPAPGNGGGPVRPRPLPRPRKPKKRGL